MKHERIDLPTAGIPLEKDHKGHFKPDTTRIHFKNWLDAIRAGDPKKCNNPPDLGAAAIVLVTLGARSYREGKAFHFDSENLRVLDGDPSWAKNWETMSKQRLQAESHPRLDGRRQRQPARRAGLHGPGRPLEKRRATRGELSG